MIGSVEHVAGRLEVLVVDDGPEIARAGAELVRTWLSERERPNLIAAVGNSPLGVYAELADERVQVPNREHLRLFQLDEYVGVPATDRRSLFGWLQQACIDPWRIPAHHVERLRGDVAELERACATYDAAVTGAGGIDIAILGLGPNGHLGFNEPPSHPTSVTRVVELTPASLESNASYWGRECTVPRRALTAGLSTLLASRHILLVVTGSHKHEILHRAVLESSSPEIPASYLQHSSQVTVLADRAAWWGST